MQHCNEHHNITLKCTKYETNGGLWILIHGVISLPDAINHVIFNEKICNFKCILKFCLKKTLILGRAIARLRNVLLTSWQNFPCCFTKPEEVLSSGLKGRDVLYMSHDMSASVAAEKKEKTDNMTATSSKLISSTTYLLTLYLPAGAPPEFLERGFKFIKVSGGSLC